MFPKKPEVGADISEQIIIIVLITGERNLTPFIHMHTRNGIRNLQHRQWLRMYHLRSESSSLWLSEAVLVSLCRHSAPGNFIANVQFLTTLILILFKPCWWDLSGLGYICNYFCEFRGLIATDIFLDPTISHLKENQYICPGKNVKLW